MTLSKNPQNLEVSILLSLAISIHESTNNSNQNKAHLLLDEFDQHSSKKIVTIPNTPKSPHLQLLQTIQPIPSMDGIQEPWKHLSQVMGEQPMVHTVQEHKILLKTRFSKFA